MARFGATWIGILHFLPLMALLTICNGPLVSSESSRPRDIKPIFWPFTKTTTTPTTTKTTTPTKTTTTPTQTTTTPTKTTTSKTKTTTSKKSNSGPRCDGRYDYSLSDPADCHSYYHCKNGVLSHNECPSGQSFSPVNSKCLDSDTVNCSMPHCTDKNQHYYPDPQDCAAYYWCNQGFPYKYTCPNNQGFDPSLKKCVPFDRLHTDCQNKSPKYPFCDARFAKYYVADPKDCHLCFRCGNGRAEPYHCPAGTRFSTVYQGCVLECQFPCPSGPYPACDPGAMYSLPDTQDCTKYYVCYNGVSTAYQCPAGQAYSSATQSCVFRNYVNCNGQSFDLTPNSRAAGVYNHSGEYGHESGEYGHESGGYGYESGDSDYY